LPQLWPALHSYEQHYIEEFSSIHDHFLLVGQDNLRRYLPIEGLFLRVEPGDTQLDTLLRIACGQLAGIPFTIALSPQVDSKWQQDLFSAATRISHRVTACVMDEQQLIESMQSGKCARVRYADPGHASARLRSIARDCGVVLIETTVVVNGLIELPWYFREQSISIDYHRYGNLGHRSCEKRTAPL